MHARAISVRLPPRSAMRRPSSLTSNPRSKFPRMPSMAPSAVRERARAPGSETSVARSTAWFMWTTASASVPWSFSRSASSRRTSPRSAGSGCASRRPCASMRCPRALAFSFRHRSIEAIFRSSRGTRSDRRLASDCWTACRYSKSAGWRSPMARNVSPVSSGRMHAESGSSAVRSIFRKTVRSSEARRRSFHSLAAVYFMDGSEMRDRLEGMYHLIEAGDMKEFGEYLAETSGALLDSVPASELLTVLRKIDRTALDPLSACILPELTGDTFRAMGDLQPALLEYRHAVQQSEASRRSDRVPRLLRKIASIERCRKENAKALGHLIEAQGRLEAHPDPAERGEVLRELALLENDQGTLAEAVVHMNQAVDLATEVSEPGALARSLTALGAIEGIRGNFERGLEGKLQGLSIAQRGGNLTEIARACISAGVSLHELRRYEESLKYYDRALQIGRLVGNIRLQSYALMEPAAAMMDIGQFEAAGPVLLEAKRLIQELEGKDSLFTIDISDGQREMGLGPWTRATRLWDRGLRGLKELGSVSDYAEALTYVGRFYVEKGEFEPGLRFLEEARGIAQTVGIPSLLSEIQALVTQAESKDHHPPPARLADS